MAKISAFSFLLLVAPTAAADCSAPPPISQECLMAHDITEAKDHCTCKELEDGRSWAHECGSAVMSDAELAQFDHDVDGAEADKGCSAGRAVASRHSKSMSKAYSTEAWWNVAYKTQIVLAADCSAPPADMSDECMMAKSIEEAKDHCTCDELESGRSWAHDCGSAVMSDAELAQYDHDVDGAEADKGCSSGRAVASRHSKSMSKAYSTEAWWNVAYKTQMTEKEESPATTTVVVASSAFFGGAFVGALVVSLAMRQLGRRTDKQYQLLA